MQVADSVIAQDQCQAPPPHSAVRLETEAATADWRERVFSWTTYREVQRRAARRFPFSLSCAEEAEAYVHDHLITGALAGQYDGYAGAAAPETFLYRLISNLLEDFSRHRFGYARPPAAVRAKGSLHLGAWRLLHLERLERPAATAQLASQYQCGIPEADAVVRNVLGVCRDCGTSALSGLECGTELQAEMEALGVPDSSAIALDETHYAALLASVREVLSPPDNDRTVAAADPSDQLSGVGTWRGALVRFRDALRIDDEAVLILRMYFLEERSTAFIGHALGLTPKQVRHRRGRGLARIEEALESSGLDASDIREMLQAMADLPVEAGEY